jgi:hypothetical protein
MPGGHWDGLFLVYTNVREMTPMPLNNTMADSFYKSWFLGGGGGTCPSRFCNFAIPLLLCAKGFLLFLFFMKDHERNLTRRPILL